MAKVQPDWLPMGSPVLGYELQMDARAKPGSPQTFRHREYRYTGEEEAEWVFGKPKDNART